MRTEPAAGAARALGVRAARQSKVNAPDSFIKENPLRTDAITRVTGETQEYSLPIIFGRYPHIARLMNMQVGGRLHERERQSSQDRPERGGRQGRTGGTGGAGLRIVRRWLLPGA